MIPAPITAIRVMGILPVHADLDASGTVPGKRPHLSRDLRASRTNRAAFSFGGPGA
ncbi:hypothetical protein GCM10007385_29240 [Tateyamaria omphalii]|nr:hypothetical protein GCM10007385_29240 [Tateyamaria omphalii]